jgi:hypothetical protein
MAADDVHRLTNLDGAVQIYDAVIAAIGAAGG